MLSNNLDFNINELTITARNGKNDITNMFAEINIYDSIFSPCMTGKIIIVDASGLFKGMHLDGSEVLTVDMSKRDCTATIKKNFRIYKQTDKVEEDNVEQFILHFISNEFFKSKNSTLFTTYEASYSDIVFKIITDVLQVPTSSLNFQNFEPSLGLKKVVYANKKPIDAILDCSKKAVSIGLSPTFMFFENTDGYNFMSLDTLSKTEPIYDINFEPKNFAQTNKNSTLGARALEVVSQFNLVDNIDYGLQGATLIGVNVLQRCLHISTARGDYLTEGLGKIHTYSNPALGSNPNTRYMWYPMGPNGGGAFSPSEYVQINDPKSLNLSDDPSRYITQRPLLLKRYTTTRTRLAMPGNFDLTSGKIVNLHKPSSGLKTITNDSDPQITNKYIIIAARHIIRKNMHETILEISTDSTSDTKLYNTTQQMDEALDFGLGDYNNYTGDMT